MVRLAVTPTRWTHRTTPIRGRAPRILVVDDNQSGADALATYLELVSMSVQAAYDGRSAIALAKIWRPDIVLLDISMPGLDGFDVAKLLRADLQVSSVIIVALTAHDEAHVRARATPAEFDAYCQKGLVLDPLTRLLEQLTRDETKDPTSPTELPTLIPGNGFLPS